MNVGGGEAADQMVRMMLSGTEVMVRLSGSALKNLLALTMALASNRKVLSGKVNMGKMLRETRDLRRFPMTPQQYKQFKKLAKKHKLLYSVIKDKDDKGILKESGAMRGTSERPSIEARLKGYRAQVRKPSAPAKAISKTKTRAKPQAKAR